jgi:hypothetical protein
MQLGKTLVGAIIGAVLGILLLLVVNLVFRFDQTWLAIPVAILVGLGVRMMVATTGHPSYLRGAITGLIALATYIAGWPVVAKVATMKAEAKPAVVAADTADAGAADAEDAAEDAPVEAPKAAPPRPRPLGAANELRKPLMQQETSPWDLAFLGIAAFIAYELGRGSGGKSVVVGEETVTEVPAGTHPDA